MSGYICSLGRTLAVAVVASVVLVSPALAVDGHIETSTGHTAILHAEQPTSDPHKLALTDNSNLSTTCTTATFIGTASPNSSAFLIHPSYTGCSVFGLSATINTTGCNYEVHLTATIPETETIDGDLDVECGVGAIIIKTLTCELLVDTQQGLATVVAENSGGAGHDMTIDLTINVTGIDYTVTKDGIGCPLSKVGTYTDGDYLGTVELRGVRDLGGTGGSPEGLTIGEP